MSHGQQLNFERAKIDPGAGPSKSPAPPMGWPAVAGLVTAGLLLCAAAAGSVASLARRAEAPRTAEVASSVIAQAVEAYRAGEWEEAERAFRAIAAQAEGHARAQDYLERLLLVRRDAERLRRAEEALVAGEPERARVLASAVAPNSPLFAQSERVARGAREQLEAEGSPARPAAARQAEAGAGALDIRVALGEALALYAAGNFAQAVERASSLAAQAQGEVRVELMRWAQDARRFAEGYEALPRDGHELLAHTEEASEAVALDERLSDGHYARELRERMSSAHLAQAPALLASNRLLEACQHGREAARFVARGEFVERLVLRCENDAFRRIAEARELEHARPEKALELYREALSMALPDSASHRAAEAAIADLEWAELPR